MSVQEQITTDIRLEGISKTFHDPERGSVTAVSESNLTVEPGELMTLLGPSGCGKTTLLRMVAGFEEPTTGRIVIAGKDQTKQMANQRDIGFVFQNYALFPHMNIFDNVAYGLRLKRMRGPKLAQAVQEVLEMVGLVGMDKRFPNQLSGGEQQRVALARVIVTRPSVLLFDEPLSNLDAKRRVQMREDIRKLQKHLSITSLYVTHDQEEALAISDRIVVMNRGRIEQVGTPQQLYGSPHSVFVANFVGKTNTLYGTVERSTGDKVHVKFGGHVFQVAPGEATSRRQGEKVALLIRPEAVILASGLSEPNGRTFDALVSSVTYLGEKTEYKLEAMGHEFTATVYDPQKAESFQPGTRVSMKLPEERMAVVDA